MSELKAMNKTLLERIKALELKINELVGENSKIVERLDRHGNQLEE